MVNGHLLNGEFWLLTRTLHPNIEDFSLLQGVFIASVSSSIDWSGQVSAVPEDYKHFLPEYPLVLKSSKPLFPAWEKESLTHPLSLLIGLVAFVRSAHLKSNWTESLPSPVFSPGWGGFLKWGVKLLFISNPLRKKCISSQLALKVIGRSKSAILLW